MTTQTGLTVLDPTSLPSIVTAGMAERPGTLAGKRIGLLANNKLNAEQLLDAIYDVLADRFEVSASHRINKGNASRPAEPDLLKTFASEIDVAILANGD